MAVLVGVDWGGDGHAVCVSAAKGQVLDRFAVSHERTGLETLVARLRRQGAAAELAIARPSGLPGDAFILADILRTDGHRLRPRAPQSDAIKALRGLVRGRVDLVRARVTLANQRSGVLESLWPGAARIFSDRASPIARALLERYPTPEAAARRGPKRLAGFLAQHRYCGRRSPEALLERLHGAPDGRIVLSFPRAGRVCAAQILAELGAVRARFPTEDQFAAAAGVVAVTSQSGKSRGVGWRWACNKPLRAALTRMADNARHQSAWAADVYPRARARGCAHPHAVRLLARAWARVLWRAGTDRVAYAPGRHRGAPALAA